MRVFGGRRCRGRCGHPLLRFWWRTRRAIRDVLIGDWGSGKFRDIKAKSRVLGRRRDGGLLRIVLLSNCCGHCFELSLEKCNLHLVRSSAGSACKQCVPTSVQQQMVRCEVWIRSDVNRWNAISIPIGKHVRAISSELQSAEADQMR